jgi:ABC-2 type transport system permease protein
MNAFIYGVILQWKLDFRNKGILLTYYVVPLVFFAFMGGIFSSINPESKETLIQSMTIFGVTMGAVLGSPTPLTELYGSEIKKAYKVGHIPLYIPVINNYISATIHLLLMSVVIYFVAPIAFNASIPENFGQYFLSLLLFIITSIAVGTLLGLTVKSVSRLTMISQVIFLPSLMLSGIMFPSSLLPELLAMSGTVLPATLGFKLMTSAVLDIQLVGSLAALSVVLWIISIWRISKLKIN